MRRRFSWLELLAAGLVLAGCTSCKNVQSVGGDVGYNPATGEITAGITITFKEEPAEYVKELLVNAGAAGSGTSWMIAEVSTEAQRFAINKALMNGAVLKAGP